MQQKKLTLEEPALKYQNAYTELLQEYQNFREELVPWVLQLNSSPFEQLIKTLEDQKNGNNLPPGYVPGSTFWLIEDKTRIIGVVNIRHYLTEALRNIGGHIGYGIRPSERKKGYATLMLKLTLKEAKKLGIQNVLLTCDKANTASARVMLNNGAILDSEDIVEGCEIQRYWIPLK